MAECEIIRVLDKKTRSEQGWLHRMEPGGAQKVPGQQRWRNDDGEEYGQEDDGW